MEGHAAAYQQALDAVDTVGEFYNKVTLDFLAKFGQDDAFSLEPNDDPPNPWDFLDGEEDILNESISAEEADVRTARYNKLRSVSKSISPE